MTDCGQGHSAAALCKGGQTVCEGAGGVCAIATVRVPPRKKITFVSRVWCVACGGWGGQTVAFGSIRI